MLYIHVWHSEIPGYIYIYCSEKFSSWNSTGLTGLGLAFLSNVPDAFSDAFSSVNHL